MELVLVSGLVLMTAAIAMPATSTARDEGRARQAAAFAAARLREAKHQAVSRSASAGLVFDLVDGRWMFRLCVDGNANGLRRSDLRDGRDSCVDGAVDLATLFPGAAVQADGAVRGPDGDPPSTDPVRFGTSSIASFSPAGSCTAGSLFVRSARGTQYVVRIAGVTGRLRILRYDAASAAWREQ